MKKPTVTNYKTDTYYPKVTQAMNEELLQSNFVTAIQVFQRIQLLDRANVEKWRKGQIPYLEKVIQCNLGKASRILWLMRFHAHDLNLKPSSTDYKRKTKSGKLSLRFSKTGDKNLEEAYSRHFIKVGKAKNKPEAPEHPNQPPLTPEKEYSSPPSKSASILDNS